MSFKDIKNAIPESCFVGAVEFSQGKLIADWDGVNAGQCWGHVYAWLLAKFAGRDYFKDYGKDDKESSLLGDFKISDEAAEAQRCIKSLADKKKTIHNTAREAWRLAARDLLAEFEDAKLVHNNDVQKWGGSILYFSNGDLFLENSPRYFFLYIHGNKGGHAIGVHRPWSTFFKSSEAAIFDPNFGEFTVKYQGGIEAVLKKLGALYGEDVASQYNLEGFDGNGW
jgi:hypothetical protein